MRSSASSNRARAVARSESAARAVARRRGGRVPARGGRGWDGATRGGGPRERRRARGELTRSATRTPWSCERCVSAATRPKMPRATSARAENRVLERALDLLRRALRAGVSGDLVEPLHTQASEIFIRMVASHDFLFSVATWRPGKIVREPPWRSHARSRELRDRRRPTLRPPHPSGAAPTSRSSQPSAFSAKGFTRRGHPRTLRRIADARHRRRARTPRYPSLPRRISAPHVRHVRRRGRSRGVPRRA